MQKENILLMMCLKVDNKTMEMPKDVTRSKSFPFPDYCYFCKKKRKTVKGKVQICHQLTLKTTEETIKEAAELRNDEDVLRDIRDVDLLAKEFQVHDKCRLDFVSEEL